jgi:hypothetical protein
VDDCGKKKSGEIAGSKFKKKERRTFTQRTLRARRTPRRLKQKKQCGKRKESGAAGEASGGSVKRIVEEVYADAGPAIVSEGLDMGHAANEFAFEGREGFNFLGNFQAKLKLDSFAEFEVRRKIGAALGDIHGLRRK